MDKFNQPVGSLEDPVNYWNHLIDRLKKEIIRSDLDGARSTALEALEVSESFPPDDRKQGISLELITETLFMCGVYDYCAPYLVRLLEMYKRCLGEEHLDTSTIMHNLAVLYHKQGRNELAEHFFEKAIAIKTTNLGDSHEEVKALQVQLENVRLRPSSEATKKLQRTGQFESLKVPPDEEFTNVVS